MQEELQQSAETTEVLEDKNLGVSEESADTNESNEEINNLEFTDTVEEKQETVKKVQAPEINSEYARKRREVEKEKALQLAREQAIIETLKGINPYTGEPIKDSVDVKEYLTMREIEEKGGDPLADFSKFQKQKAKELKEKEIKELEQEEWIDKDKDDFVAKYPEVDLEELVSDKTFRIFAEGKVGVRPMTEIYEAFQNLNKTYEQKAKEKAARILANANASPGSLKGTNANNDIFYSAEDVKKMSQAEVSKNYEKIRESMKNW